MASPTSRTRSVGSSGVGACTIIRFVRNALAERGLNDCRLGTSPLRGSPRHSRSKSALCCERTRFLPIAAAWPISKGDPTFAHGAMFPALRHSENGIDHHEGE